MFTGDALFVGDTGRTDLPDPEKTGDNAGILYDSIHRKIAPLGDQKLLFPAHGAGSACSGNISEREDSTQGMEKRRTRCSAKAAATSLPTNWPRKWRGRRISCIYFYAEISGYLASMIEKIDNRGGIMLPDVLGLRLAVFLALFVPLLIVGLFASARLAP